MHEQAPAAKAMQTSAASWSLTSSRSSLRGGSNGEEGPALDPAEARSEAAAFPAPPAARAAGRLRRADRSFALPVSMTRAPAPPTRASSTRQRRRRRMVVALFVVLAFSWHIAFGSRGASRLFWQASRPDKDDGLMVVILIPPLLPGRCQPRAPQHLRRPISGVHAHRRVICEPGRSRCNGYFYCWPHLRVNTVAMV